MMMTMMMKRMSWPLWISSHPGLPNIHLVTPLPSRLSAARGRGTDHHIRLIAYPSPIHRR
jgi:hypothetical protein